MHIKRWGGRLRQLTQCINTSKYWLLHAQTTYYSLLYSVGLSNNSLSPVYPCCCHPAACTTLLLLILLMFSNTRRWKIWSDHCGYWYCQHTHSRWKKAIKTTIIISWSIQFHGKINPYRILTLLLFDIIGALCLCLLLLLLIMAP